MAENAVREAEKLIGIKPEEKLNELRAPHCRDSMPENSSDVRRGLRCLIQAKIFHTLGVKMNFTLIVAGQAFEEFCNGTLGTVAAVHEGGNNLEPQVSASGDAASAHPLEQTAQKQRR